MKQLLNNSYLGYIDPPRHWCQQCQPYAGVDALLSFLDGGWTIVDEIGRDEHWLGGTRRILVYYFILANRDDVITMPVLCNPVLDRLLAELYQRGTSVVNMEQESDTGTNPRPQKHPEPRLKGIWSMS